MSDEPWIIDERNRYSNLQLIGWWDQDKLRRARIMVVGAGALGNEVLKNLALLGVGELHLVDFDRIELANLTRSVLFRERDCGRAKAVVAAEAIRELNPDVQVWPWEANIITDIGLGLFRDVDLVIGCLDNREARLWVNRQCWKVSKPWIDGGIQEIQGVVKVFCPPHSACYECGMTEMDYRLINLRYSCPLLPREDLAAGKVPTAPTIASMIGGLQVQEALKLLHALPISSGCAIVYNGISNQMYRTAFSRNEDCLSHETWSTIVDLPLTVNHTVADLVRAVKDHFGGGDDWQIHLERDLVVGLKCTPCGWRKEPFQTIQKLGTQHSRCEICGQMASPEIIYTVDAASPWTHRPLHQFGIPAYDVVRVMTSEGPFAVCLAGDKPDTVMASNALA